MAGKLYAIGVGPGDPELMTIKAVEILKTVGHVFAPVSRNNGISIACDIAKKSIPEKTEHHKLITHCLQAMSRGGIYDVVGGGFSRYSTDNFWRIPHFEN